MYFWQIHPKKTIYSICSGLPQRLGNRENENGQGKVSGKSGNKQKLLDVSKIDLSNLFSNDKIHMPKQHGPSFTGEPYGQ